MKHFRHVSFVVLIAALARISVAAPAGPPAGSPILNSHLYQRGTEMNIDTATIRRLAVSTVTNVPSLLNGLEINGAFYNSSAGTPFVTKAIFNVRDFGARGDNLADDAASIQAAVNAAYSQGAGIVYFPEGTYLVGASLTAYPRVTWRGEGPSTSVLRAKNGLNDRLIRNAGLSDNDPDIVFEDLLFDLNGQNQTASTAITISKTERHAVRRCEFRNPYDSLYLLTGSPTVTWNLHAVIEDSFFWGAGQQQSTDLVDIGAGTDIVVRRCRFEDAKPLSNIGMFEPSSINHFIVEDCYFDGKGNATPVELKGIDGGKFDGNEVKGAYGNGFGFWSWFEINPPKLGQNFEIINNNIHDNAGPGIYFTSPVLSTEAAKNVRIANNSIWNNGQQALKIQLADNLVISNNTIFHNSTTGAGTYPAIDLNGPFGSKHIRVYGNSFYDETAVPTQTFIYHLIDVATFTSHNNFYANVSTFKTVSSSTNTLFLDETSEGAKSVVGNFSRDNTVSSGTVSYTGLGFKPVGVSFVSAVLSTNTFSWGFDSVAASKCFAMTPAGGADTWASQSIVTEINASNYQAGHVISFDDDGFTIYWTKVGSPTGTMNVNYQAFR